MAAASFDMDGLRARLSAMADEEYRSFNQSLTPGNETPALGVRLPQLRALARELLRSDWRGFLDASRKYLLQEALLLHAIVLGGARCPIEEKLALTDAFLPSVTDWAVCDTLCSSFKPRSAERDALFDFVCDCALSDAEFRKRFGLVMMMHYFREAPWAGRVMEIYRGFSHPGYYARMGAAWGLATLFLYQREAALAILKDGVWDDFTHNKAIQKLRESYRVPEEDKRMLSQLRRKAVKSRE